MPVVAAAAAAVVPVAVVAAAPLDVPAIIDESLLTSVEKPPALVLAADVAPVLMLAAPVAVVPFEDVPDDAVEPVEAALDPVPEVPVPLNVEPKPLDAPEPSEDMADIIGPMLDIIIDIIISSDMFAVEAAAPAVPAGFAPPKPPAVVDVDVHELLQEDIVAFSRPNGVIQTIVLPFLDCVVPLIGVT